MTKSKNSQVLDKLSFLDNIHVENRRNGYVRVGLKSDLVNDNLMYFRIFKLNEGNWYEAIY